MIIAVKYLPKDEYTTGNPIQVKYDNGNISVFNYVEEHPMYETVHAWVADGNVIEPADTPEEAE